MVSCHGRRFSETRGNCAASRNRHTGCQGTDLLTWARSKRRWDTGMRDEKRRIGTVAYARPGTSGDEGPRSVLKDKPSPKAGEIELAVNGRSYRIDTEHGVSSTATLATVLREHLALTGLKVPCDQGACGACTVILDGKAVLACMVLAVEAQGHRILTIEGLAEDDGVVRAFAEQSEPGYGTALQCGFCTPGFVMTARAFLNRVPSPTISQIKEALSGNICRCGCYAGIAQAVERASAALTKDGDR